MLLYNDSVDRSVCCLSALCCVVWYPDLFVCLCECLFVCYSLLNSVIIFNQHVEPRFFQRAGRTEPITKPGSPLESRPPTIKATGVRKVAKRDESCGMEVGSMRRIEVEFIVCFRRSCVVGLFRQSCGTCMFRLAHTRCADEFAGVLVCVIALWWRSCVLLHEV